MFTLFYHYSLIHLLVNKHIECFYFPAFINKAAVVSLKLCRVLWVYAQKSYS